jgi:hypothetical protein
MSNPPPDSIQFPSEIRTRGKGLRPALRTTTEALRLIDKELPAELRGLSRWTFARALLVEAEKTGKKRDITCAFRQVKQALANEGWLEPDGSEPDGEPENGAPAATSAPH